MLLEKGVPKRCSKFTGGHPCRSAISIKLQSISIEITHRYGCSPVNLLHIFRTTFSKNTSGWLLLCTNHHNLIWTVSSRTWILWHESFEWICLTILETIAEAVVQRCSAKTICLKIAQNSQANTCVRVSFKTKLHASDNKAPLVAASEIDKFQWMFWK